MLHGETVQSPLPQDIPWWSPDFAIFFGILYIVLLVIGSGLGLVMLQTLRDCCTRSKPCAEPAPEES